MLPKARPESAELAAYPLATGETILFDVKAYRAINLNPAACLIWRRCDGETSIAQLAEALQTDLRIDADEATVWAGLESLRKEGLLESCPPCPPGLTAALRRRLRRRLVIASGVAIASSILVPPAWAAATCIPNHAGCTPKGDPCAINAQCCSCACNTSSGKCSP